MNMDMIRIILERIKVNQALKHLPPTERQKVIREKNGQNKLIKKEANIIMNRQNNNLVKCNLINLIIF